MNNLSPFCTCRDKDCPYNPVNHDMGCSLCIEKNLKLGEIPSCFYNKVDPEYKGPNYYMEDFAHLVLKKKNAE